MSEAIDTTNDWFCEICKHIERHIPRAIDETRRRKGCERCPRCKRFRESLKSPVPPGALGELSRLYARYRSR